MKYQRWGAVAFLVVHLFLIPFIPPVQYAFTRGASQQMQESHNHAYETV